MVKKTINVGGVETVFCASAATPRIYRLKFQRDIFKDFQKLQKVNAEYDEYAITDLELFENIAYVMAYQGDHSIPSTIDDWLDRYEMFSIYEILPELLDLWGMNIKADVESKKKFAEVAGK